MTAEIGEQGRGRPSDAGSGGYEKFKAGVEPGFDALHPRLDYGARHSQEGCAGEPAQSCGQGDGCRQRQGPAADDPVSHVAGGYDPVEDGLSGTRNVGGR